MSAPRPYATAISIHTTQRSSYFLLVVNPGVSWYGVYLMMAHALLQKR